MLWARYSTRWWEDPRVLGLSRDAELMYARAIAYAREQLSDGVIARAALPHLGQKLDNPLGCAKEITVTGLWERRGRDFMFPPATWARYQTTNADINERRKADTDRKRAWRASQNATKPSQRDAPVASASRDGPQEQSKALDQNPLSSALTVRPRARRAGRERDINEVINDVAASLKLPEEA